MNGEVRQIRFRGGPACFVALLAMGAACNASDPGGSNAPAPPRAAATAFDQAAARPGSAPLTSTTEKFGDALHDTALVALSSIAQNPAQYAKNVVKTEGKVTAVCQNMGCWMEITDQRADAHIRMSGHRFFIPKSAAGRHAIVEGTVLSSPSNGECEKEAEEATGKTVRVELVATGVELL